MAHWSKFREREIMERLGLKRVPLSGASWISKEDGESDKILAQLKSTDAKSISLKLQDLRDLIKHANIAHKMPLFVLDFRSVDEVLIAMRPDDMVEILAALTGQDAEDED